jgi:hypothetical protein
MLHSANHSCSIPNWHDKNDVNIIILFVDILNTHSCCGLLTLNCFFYMQSIKLSPWEGTRMLSVIILLIKKAKGYLT